MYYSLDSYVVIMSILVELIELSILIEIILYETMISVGFGGISRNIRKIIEYYSLGSDVVIMSILVGFIPFVLFVEITFTVVELASIGYVTPLLAQAVSTDPNPVIIPLAPGTVPGSFRRSHSITPPAASPR